MIRFWILWVLWLAGTLFFSIFSLHPAAAAVLLISVLLPAVGMIVHRLLPAKITFGAQLPACAERGQTVHGTLTVKNRSLLCCRRMEARVQFCNLLTGEEAGERLSAVLYGGETVSFSLKWKDDFCGTIRLSCGSIRLYDFFGLTFRTIPITWDSRMVILPSVFPVEVQLTALDGRDAWQEEYAQNRSGPDFSELFDFRDYSPGDNPRSIHWKLTHKMDRLIVRDGGLPVEKSVLLLLETGMMEGEEPPSPQVKSAMAEAVVSVSQSLCEEKIRHQIAWQDQETRSFCRYPVENEEALNAVLPKLLSAGSAPAGQTVLSCCAGDPDCEAFAHLVCVTPKYPASVEQRAEWVTLLLAGDRKQGAGAIPTFCFTPQTMEQDLGLIKI